MLMNYDGDEEKSLLMYINSDELRLLFYFNARFEKNESRCVTGTTVCRKV